MRESTSGRSINRWARHALFAGYYTVSGRRSVLTSVDRLDRLHFASRHEIDAEVHRRLLDLLTHAHRTVPYYRELIDGEHLKEATVEAALREMPILTKDTIRENTEQLVSEKPGTRLRWNTSGGSTGEPVRLRQDRRMDSLRTTNKLLFMRWAGYKIGEPHVMIWGVPKETFGEKIPLRKKIYCAAHNQTFLNCYGIDDGTLDDWVCRINAIRPAVIEAYADAIYELSQRVLADRVEIASPRGIITSAGVLTPHRRRVIGKAFGCPILNRYGSREVSDMACSCLSSDELHVNEFSCYLEIVDAQGLPCEVGVEGDILVTLFTNYSMPLIRYRIEDRGMWADGPCPCGRNSKRLAAVCGRQTDYLIASDGTRLSGTALTTLLYPVAGIRRYQYRQTDEDSVTLAVMPVHGVNVDELRDDLSGPIGQLESLLKGGIVDLTIVDDIVPSKSGKFRYIQNDLASRVS